MSIAAILNYVDPGCWSTIDAEYSGDYTEPSVQAYLDASVVWATAPVAASVVIANKAAWEAVRDAAVQEQTDDRTDEVAIKTDPTVRALITARPAQIESYIATNVTDLDSAKTVLTILAKAVSALGKREFKEAG